MSFIPRGRVEGYLVQHGGAAAVEVGLEVFEELVEGAAEGVGGELDRGAVVAQVDDQRLAFEGIGLAVEEVVGVFEDDGDGSPFISGEDDRFEALDLGPGDVAGGEATGVVGEAGVIDDEAGAVLYNLAEVEGAEEETHGNDEDKQDAEEDGKDETGSGLRAAGRRRLTLPGGSVRGEQGQSCQLGPAVWDNGFVVGSGSMLSRRKLIKTCDLCYPYLPVPSHSRPSSKR